MVLHFTVSELGQSKKLSVFLRQQGISTALLRSVKYTKNGIYVNGKASRTNQILKIGDKVYFSLPEEEEPAIEPEDIPLEVLCETEHFIAINKSTGMVMHPTRTHKTGTVANAYIGLMKKRGENSVFRSVGRLDAGTSGVVICAKNPYAVPLLSKNMQKGYVALVEGKMPLGQGKISMPISVAEGSLIQQSVSLQGKPSVTEYFVLAVSEKASLVLVWPRTGRTHQIRVHFSWLGHPLIGDTLYGGIPISKGVHMLHCAFIQIGIDMTEEKQISVEFPKWWKEELTERDLGGISAEQIEKILEKGIRKKEEL